MFTFNKICLMDGMYSTEEIKGSISILLAPVSQKVGNRTISDHLPTMFATVSQNLSECFYYFRFPTCGYDVFFVRRYENRSIYSGRAPIR